MPFRHSITKSLLLPAGLLVALSLTLAACGNSVPQPPISSSLTLSHAERAAANQALKFVEPTIKPPLARAWQVTAVAPSTYQPPSPSPTVHLAAIPAYTVTIAGNAEKTVCTTHSKAKRNCSEKAVAAIDQVLVARDSNGVLSFSTKP